MKKYLFLILFSLFFFFPPKSFAEVIHSFDVDITAHKNGLMDFTENIEYDFQDSFRHGIFRNIPLYSKVGDLYRIYKIENVKVLRDGKSEETSLSQDREQVIIKIGDPDKEITGNHKYTIFYTVENGIGSNFADHDEIYWNITGNEWNVNIEKASVLVSTDFNANLNELICFEGQYGSSVQDCKTDKNRASTSQLLFSGEGLTIVAVYPPDTFPKSILSKTPPQTFVDKFFAFFAKYFLQIWLFINVVIPAILLYRYFKNKNKSQGKPTVNFDIPKDEKGERLAPALSGAIDSTKLEKDDITATIFDLAIRKYIKIEGKKVNVKFGPDKNEQIITKLKENDKLLPFEKTLMDKLFKYGDSVKVSEITSFYATFSKMEEQVFDTLIKKNYYTKNPKTQKQVLLVFALIAFFTSNAILGAVLAYLSLVLNARTEKGDALDSKIDGLKIFLKNMDRNYKWQAEKFYTVEQMIPYAMSLGYIDEFMQALKVLKPDYNPSWYSGTGNFYASYALFNVAASSQFTTSAPSSSSGSSGGFSGGGGGGGGGGSW